MMDVEKILETIQFRCIPPDVFYQLNHLNLRGQSIPFDLINTDLGSHGADILPGLDPLLDIPRMSTLAIGYLINRLVSQLPPDQCYVNIGVWQGFSFFSALVNNADKLCIGVDNFSQFEGRQAFQAFKERYELFKTPVSRFYEMSYQNYFQMEHHEPIGLYFYDGNHSYEDQLNALIVAEPFLTQDALIIVDDTNWDQVRRATTDFMAFRPGNYRIVCDLTTACNQHPTYWNGLMVLQQTGDTH